MNRTASVLFGAAIFALGATPFACGNSDSSSGGGYSSGLPGSEGLKDLSPSDAASFCKSANAYLASNPSLGDLTCNTRGLVAAFTASFTNSSAADADVQKACSDAVTQCKTAPPPAADAGTGTGTGTGMTCGTPTAMCTTTVAQMEACINDESAALSSAAAAIPSCGSLTAMSLRGLLDGGMFSAGAPMEPASCQTAYANCPMQ